MMKRRAFLQGLLSLLALIGFIRPPASAADSFTYGGYAVRWAGWEDEGDVGLRGQRRLVGTWGAGLKRGRKNWTRFSSHYIDADASASARAATKSDALAALKAMIDKQAG